MSQTEPKDIPTESPASNEVVDVPLNDSSPPAKETPTTPPKPNNMMKALFITKSVDCWCGDENTISAAFEVGEAPIPTPRSGQVLIKVERSPLNPSDLSTLKGTYGSSKGKEYPYIAGYEGSGVVVANGGGVLGWRLVNKRVACVVPGKGGMWAEYVVAPANQCIVLNDDVTFETGSSAFVNPLTAVSFLEIAAAGGHKSFLHTAAASALGKMTYRLAQSEGVEVVCVVRRDSQVQELKRIGVKYVLNSTDDDFKAKLKETCELLGCRLAFDAVGGSLVGTVLHQMPARTQYYIYGGLANEHCSGIPVGDFIFSSKEIKGFWLSSYIKSKNILGLILWQRKVQNLLNTTLRTDVRASYPLDRVGEAINTYVGNMSSGKVLLAPTLSKVKEEQTTSQTEKEEAVPSASTPTDNSLFSS